MSGDLTLDKIRGSLVAGGIGDALGYPIEFRKYRDIEQEFGSQGLTGYQMLRSERKAYISDDTQMTLFTANGLLICYTNNIINRVNDSPEKYVYRCYLDWLTGQNGRRRKQAYSWLYSIKSMRTPRAPGITCLSALESGIMGTTVAPVNRSKGCGGIMRVAPVGLFYDNNTSEESIMKLAAEIAAITHGHSLGYMPAAAFAHIIHRIVYGRCRYGNSLEAIVLESNYLVEKIYKGDSNLRYYIELINKAVDLSKNDRSDVVNIEEIGGGWVAEEALAAAVYCCLKYSDNFDKAIIASVNHSGDSDSTGSITGNIIGASIGYDRIPDKWKNPLEQLTTIVEISDDLYQKYSDSESWRKKYCIQLPQR